MRGGERQQAGQRAKRDAAEDRPQQEAAEQAQLVVGLRVAQRGEEQQSEHDDDVQHREMRRGDTAVQAQPAAPRLGHQDVERREREGLREPHGHDAGRKRGDDLQQARLDDVRRDADAGARRHREGEHREPARRQNEPQPDASAARFAPGARPAGRDEPHQALHARRTQHDGGENDRDGHEAGRRMPR